MALKIKDETGIYDVATLHHVIDSRCRRVFKDLISRRNATHWDPMDIEYFLLTPGKLVSKRITRTFSELPEALALLFASGQFKNTKKIIVCAYGNDIALEDWVKVINGIIAFIPANAEIFNGIITEERVGSGCGTVHLIAVCSRTAEDALFFYQYVSQYIKDDFNIEGCYAYKRIDAGRDVFLELEHNKLKVGYRGIDKMEKDLSVLLNHNQFERFFSEVIVDTAQDKIYKNYFFNHEITDDMKNIMEALYIKEMLSVLEHRYEDTNKLTNQSV
jgi:hypothetical protein